MTPQSSWSTVSNGPSSPLPHAAKSQLDCLTNPIFANWIDGILILTEDGQWVESNGLGRSICDRIAQEQPCINQIPQEIWKACQVLIDSRSDFPNHLVIAESELKLKQSHDHIRIRARWFTPGNKAEPHILIILENQKQSWQNLAITETIRYNLSPRESDVWTLHRMGYTYQQISAELHIALNTVKKHVKSTYAKQNIADALDKPYPDTIAS